MYEIKIFLWYSLTLLCGIYACTWKNINYPDSLRLSFVFSIINIDSPKPFN